MMLRYDECKEIALRKAEEMGCVINSAYELGKNAYVFNDTTKDYVGVLPIVVDRNSGICSGLWYYLINSEDLTLTMDDMKEVEF